MVEAVDCKDFENATSKSLLGGGGSLLFRRRSLLPELIDAYPSVSQAKWARIESSVNLGPWGNPDPYSVSLDLATGSTELRCDCLYL